MNRQAWINREKGTDDEHNSDEYRKGQCTGTLDIETENIEKESGSGKARQGREGETNVQEERYGEWQENERSSR